MLIDHNSQVFTCTDGCAASAGPVLGLVLSSGSEDVPRLFLRRRGLFCVCSSVRGASTSHTGASLVLGRLAGITNVGCTQTMKEVDARQRCDFLFRASLCLDTPGARIIQSRWQAHVGRPVRAVGGVCI